MHFNRRPELAASVRRGILIGGVVASAACAGGCIVVGGTSHRAAEPTVGQQLIDLHRAQQEGAMTPEEYQRERERLLRAAQR